LAGRCTSARLDAFVWAVLDFRGMFKFEFITRALRLVDITEIKKLKKLKFFHIDFAAVAVLHSHYTTLAVFR
jgi:hypothetical protein